MIEKVVEGKNVSYVIPFSRTIDDYPLFMDVTRVVEGAIRRDLKCGYDAEGGPNYAIEHHRAVEYANYVNEHMSRDNYYKFDTANYRFFLGSVAVR